jgi:hypothetical protein
MSKSRPKAAFALNDALFVVKQRKPVPHEFVLDALAPLSPRTRQMFGCLAIYVEDKIVLILRDKNKDDKSKDGKSKSKPGQTADNGVWLATTREHHQSLLQDFPNMRSIKVLGEKVTGWQILPADAPDFEEAALRACEFVLAGDPRIGKVPGARRAKVPKKGKRRVR